MRAGSNHEEGMRRCVQSLTCWQDICSIRRDVPPCSSWGVVAADIPGRLRTVGERAADSGGGRPDHLQQTQLNGQQLHPGRHHTRGGVRQPGGDVTVEPICRKSVAR
jgi:hypothetical protein